jgi:hypothetical protein
LAQAPRRQTRAAGGVGLRAFSAHPPNFQQDEATNQGVAYFGGTRSVLITRWNFYRIGQIAEKTAIFPALCALAHDLLSFP